MGYYTYYSLKIEPEDSDIFKRIREEEKARDEHAGFWYGFDDNGESQDTMKWYEWEEDMRRISYNHPNHTFHLSGNGEDNDDIWEATFKEGMAHIRQAEIHIAPYDPEQLS